MNKTRRFRDVKINEEFRFLSEVQPMFAGGGMKHGPWRKISARKYVHVHDGMECHVGSINAEVAN